MRPRKRMTYEIVAVKQQFDPYRKIAARKYGVEESEVTFEQRQRIKKDVLFSAYAGQYDTQEAEIVCVTQVEN